MFKQGQKVEVNGNKEAVILQYHKDLKLYEVRLYQGFRHVGDVIVPKESIKALLNG